MDSKICTVCGIVKSAENFAFLKMGSVKRKARCRDCIRKIAADRWRDKTDEEKAAIIARRGQNNGSKKRMPDKEARARIPQSLSFTPIEPFPGSRNKWRGIHEPCGKEITPNAATIFRSGNICPSCTSAKNTAWTDEEARSLASPDFQPLEPYPGSVMVLWRGIHTACGREVGVRLLQMKRGEGCCKSCGYLLKGEAHRGFDRIYICVSDAQVKFGVSSNGNRVKNHKRKGYNLHRQWLNLSHDTAFDTEKFTLLALRELNIHPVKGQEYFDISNLPIIESLLSGRLDMEGVDSN